MDFNLPLPPIWVTRYTRPDPRRFSQDFRVTLEITKQLVLLLYICLMVLYFPLDEINIALLDINTNTMII